MFWHLHSKKNETTKLDKRKGLQNLKVGKLEANAFSPFFTRQCNFYTMHFWTMLSKETLGENSSVFSHFHNSLVMAMGNWGERLGYWGERLGYWGERLGYWVAELAKNVDIGEILSVSPKCRDQTRRSEVTNRCWREPMGQNRELTTPSNRMTHTVEKHFTIDMKEDR